MQGAVSDGSAAAWRGFLGLDQNLGKTYKEQADAAYQGDKLRDAARLYSLVLDFTPNDVEVMGKLGFARKEIGNYEGAIAVLERAIAASPDEFQLYWWLADAQRMLGRYDDSVVNMSKARDLAPADQKSDLGDYVTFTQGLASKEKSWANFDKHVALANRHDLLRRSRRCVTEYLLAATLAPAESDETNNANLRVGLAFSNTGIQYSFMKEPDVAIEYFQRAQKYFESGNLTDWRMRTQQNLAVAYIVWAGQEEARREDLLNKSVEHWEAAFDLAKAREDAEYTRFTRGSLLQTLAALYPTSNPVLTQVREDNRKELPFSGPVTEFSVAAVCMGEIACRLSERDFAGARIVIETVLPYYEGTNFLLDNEEAVRLRTAAANVYAYQGHHKQALESASKALDQMKAVRGYMDSDTYNRSDNEKTYRHAVSAFVRAAVNSGDAEAAWTSFERYRSMAQEDLLGSKVRDEAVYTDVQAEAALLQTRLAELNASLAAAQAAGDATQTAFLEERVRKDEARSAWLQQNIQLPAPSTLAYKPLGVEEAAALKASLPADITLVAYIFDPTGGTALVCSPAGVQGVVLEGATDAVLYDLAAQARTALAGDPAAATPVLEQLHQLLLAPVLPLITTPHIVFAPDEVLRYLPFEALQTGGKALVDTHTVSYVNSGSYLNHAFGKERTANAQLRALVPDAAYAALLAPALDALPGAERLLEASATESRARDIQGFDLLHISCAADLTAADPMLSVLRLGADDQQDGSFFAAEWLAAYSPAATVLLDLDYTLDSSAVRGNDLIAFAEGTVHAGVPAFITNLWAPPAAERAAFLTLFYQQLATQGRAAAMVAAKRAFRQQYPASNAWAAYVLWGDYR
jgi:CHAT domain-containing protein